MRVILAVVAQHAALADGPKLASHHRTGLFAITAVRAGDVSGHYNCILDEKHGGHCAHPSSELTWKNWEIRGSIQTLSLPCQSYIEQLNPLTWERQSSRKTAYIYIYIYAFVFHGYLCLFKNNSL